jgi:hypothetical protein
MIVASAGAGVLMAGMCAFAVLAPAATVARHRTLTKRVAIHWAVAAACAASWAMSATSSFDGENLLRSLSKLLAPWPWALVAGAFGVGAVSAISDGDPHPRVSGRDHSRRT